MKYREWGLLQDAQLNNQSLAITRENIDKRTVRLVICTIVIVIPWNTFSQELQ